MDPQRQYKWNFKGYQKVILRFKDLFRLFLHLKSTSAVSLMCKGILKKTLKKNDVDF